MNYGKWGVRGVVAVEFVGSGGQVWNEKVGWEWGVLLDLLRFKLNEWV